jgi:hypothetical protein
VEPDKAAQSPASTIKMKKIRKIRATVEAGVARLYIVPH